MPARDPVCGMTVDPARAAASADFGGTLYYSPLLKRAEKFRSDPEKYLTAKVPEAVHGWAVSTQFAQLGGIKPASSGMVATIVPASESGASVAEGSATSAPAHAREPEPHPRRTAKPAPPHAQAAAYICPMDPEVRAGHPGACPNAAWRSNPNARRSADAHRIHLPDASGNRARRARLLPDLRHGSRTAHRAGRRGRKSRTRFHDAPLLGQRRA